MRRRPFASPLTVALWVLAGASVAATVAGGALALSDGYGLSAFGVDQIGLLSVAMAIAFSVLGASILTIHPRDRVGWVLSATGLQRAVLVFAVAWAHHGLVTSPGSLPGAEAATWLGLVAVLAGAPLLPLWLAWFPDGSTRSPFAWIPAACATLVALVAVVAVLAWPLKGVDLLVNGDAPPSTLHTVGDWLSNLVLLGQFGIGAASLVSLLDKARRAGPGVVRQQIGAVGFGAVIALVGALIADIDEALWPCRIAGFSVFMLAVTAAVFRFRLWDIDRLIKGTIVYGLLSAVLAAIAGILAVIIGVLFGGRTGGSIVAAAAAAGGAGLALRPAHRLVQQRLDQLFDRRGWEAVHRVRNFTARLGSHTPAPEALELLLKDVLDDPHLTLRYRLQDGTVLDPTGASLDATAAGEPTSTVNVGSCTALISHRPMTRADGNHLERVLAAATVALEHGRMLVELQLQLTELRTSRARIVEAADAERCRLERDLHDGIQAQLVALGLNVRTRQRRLRGPVSPAMTTLIDEAVAGIQDAISALRDVARGVLSPLLVSDGLPGAIADLVRRLPVPVTLEVCVPERLHLQVESTAWYVTCEALTNALKHAPGAPAKVSIGRDAHDLHVVVSDAGPGGADPGRGTGLRGLTDRVEAVGGRLAVISNSQAGTVVEAILPCV